MNLPAAAHEGAKDTPAGLISRLPGGCRSLCSALLFLIARLTQKAEGA